MDSAGETQEERQGKMLLHTEYSLLSLLHNQDGVVHHHGLFQVDWPLHTFGYSFLFLSTGEKNIFHITVIAGGSFSLWCVTQNCG